MVLAALLLAGCAPSIRQIDIPMDPAPGHCILTRIGRISVDNFAICRGADGKEFPVVPSGSSILSPITDLLGTLLLL